MERAAKQLISLRSEFEWLQTAPNRPAWKRNTPNRVQDLGATNILLRNAFDVPAPNRFDCSARLHESAIEMLERSATGARTGEGPARAPVFLERTRPEHAPLRL